MIVMNETIKTKSGTLYTIDKVNKTLIGGLFTEPVEYVSLDIHLGNPATIVLATGDTLRTSPVVQTGSYKQEKETNFLRFKTKNSTYVVDLDKMTISGGVLEEPLRLAKEPSVVVGEKASILLEDGRTITTSRVINIEKSSSCEKVSFQQFDTPRSHLYDWLQDR